MTEQSDRMRLAVLIDTDNISAAHARRIMVEVAEHGTATVKRAYGDWSSPRLGKWRALLPQLAIQPQQQFAYTTGKNATDSALIIDAMDLLYADNVDGFVLVSSDSDFTPLAMRLRASGSLVYGIGARKTPRAFTEACDRFIFVEVLLEEEDSDAEPEPAAGAEESEQQATPVELPNLQSILTRAINATAQDDGWATLSAVGTQLVRIESSFDPRLWHKTKLVDLVEAQNFVDVERGPGSVRVRLRSARPRKKAAKS